MIIRNATREDIPRIVEMAQQFYATTSYAEICPASVPSIAGLAILTIEQGVMLVAENEGRVVGMASLFIEPFTFNVSMKVANELAWWIDPEHRGGMLAVRMMKAIEAECIALEADVIRMGVMEDSPPQAAAMYGRMGYARSDSHYMKVIQ